MVYDALEMTYRKIKVRKDPDCALCGENPTVTDLLEDYEDFCGAVSAEAQEAAIDADDHRARAQGVAGRGKDVFLVDVREPAEYEIVQHPGRDADPQGRHPVRRGAGPVAAGPADRAALQVRRALAPRRSPR